MKTGCLTAERGTRPRPGSHIPTTSRRSGRSPSTTACSTSTSPSRSNRLACRRRTFCSRSSTARARPHNDSRMSAMASRERSSGMDRRAPRDHVGAQDRGSAVHPRTRIYDRTVRSALVHPQQRALTATRRRLRRRLRLADLVCGYGHDRRSPHRRLPARIPRRALRASHVAEPPHRRSRRPQLNHREHEVVPRCRSLPGESQARPACVPGGPLLEVRDSLPRGRLPVPARASTSRSWSHVGHVRGWGGGSPDAHARALAPTVHTRRATRPARAPPSGSTGG